MIAYTKMKYRVGGKNSIILFVYIFKYIIMAK